MLDDKGLKKRTRLILYFDFYGQLLTEKQRDIFGMYYLNDYSLGEISDELRISRQGVYDSLKRAEKSLNEYESKLGLVKRFEFKRNELKDIFMRLKKLEDVVSDKDKHIISDIISELNSAIEGML